jgi:hypothetical protein
VFRVVALKVWDFGVLDIRAPPIIYQRAGVAAADAGHSGHLRLARSAVAVLVARNTTSPALYVFHSPSPLTGFVDEALGTWFKRAPSTSGPAARQD